MVFALVLAFAMTVGALVGTALRGAGAGSGGLPVAHGRPTPTTLALAPGRTPPPSGAPGASATPIPDPGPSLSPRASPTTGPTASAGPVDIDLAPDAAAVFSSQLTKELCAPAGLTSALATMGLVTASDAVQRQVESHIGQWTSWADSHNGGWGPLAMTKALAYYGAPGYVVRAYATRDAALRAAAIALSATHSPVLLLAWWGAHTWVMTGYRATADLASDPRATLTGAYIIDPWYPKVSSIWGHVQPPGHLYDLAGLAHNYIAWKRPEGHYPDRDGRWVVVIPTLPRLAEG